MHGSFLLDAIRRFGAIAIVDGPEVVFAFDQGCYRQTSHSKETYGNESRQNLYTPDLVERFQVRDLNSGNVLHVCLFFNGMEFSMS